MSTSDAIMSLGRARPMTGRGPLVPGAGAADASRLLDSRQGAFASVLGRAGPSRGGDSTPESKAREAAAQFVAITFVQPVLKQVRESNRAAPPFGPSEGERGFRAMLDADLAQRIVQRSDWPLVDRLATDLLKRREGETIPRASTTATDAAGSSFRDPGARTDSGDDGR